MTYRRLDHKSLNIVRTQIGDIKLWLIDEISMVGHRLFSFIDQRLQEIHNSTQPFGETSVIAFDNFFQLPSVLDGFIFEDFSSCKSRIVDYNRVAPNLWTELLTMFELTHVMRQQDCIQFVQLLNRHREGSHTTEDIRNIESRTITSDADNYPLSAQHLRKTNLEVGAFNNHIYQLCSNEKYLVKAVGVVIGSVSDNTNQHILNTIPDDSGKTMQLSRTLPLAAPAAKYQ